jgi:hypothetical protein
MNINPHVTILALPSRTPAIAIGRARTTPAAVYSPIKVPTWA